MKFTFQAAVMLSALTLPVSAGSMDSMSTAVELGNMLASEDFCGLTYDQTAIEAYIEKHVKAEDMSFASSLQMMTDGKKFQLKDISASAKTAHCKQVTRSARANGFTK